MLQENLSMVGNDKRAIADCFEYCLQDLEAFKTIVESATVSNAVDTVIKKIQIKLISLYPDEFVTKF